MAPDGSGLLRHSVQAEEARENTSRAWAPPWLLENRDLIEKLQNALFLDQAALRNKLNHLNFCDRHLFAQFQHLEYGDHVLIRARPEPCQGDRLTCHWVEKGIDKLHLEHYRFRQLVIPGGEAFILVPAELENINRLSFTVLLPERSYAVGDRMNRRHACRDVTADLTQGGFLGRGELMDFSPAGFRIRVQAVPPSSFHWFDPSAPMIVHLHRQEQVLFSGLCDCVRQKEHAHGRDVVVVPADEFVRKLREEQIRSPRQELSPSPTLLFVHPFLGRRVQLEVSEISTSGFSVQEDPKDGLLMQGMIIPELTIDFSGAVSMKCSAQVVYRIPESEKDAGVRCGLAILDMDIQAYSVLTQILTKARDPHAYISNRVDMDALWEFFFESGFIYPTKYKLIRQHREEFKATYARLYEDSPDLARHFTCQKNGRIYGHISMVHAYPKAWMIHHYASRSMGRKRPGFMVLKQLMYFLNDMHRLPSAHMDFAMAYFRPENKFPDRVFGGFTRHLSLPRGCSMDLFAYLLYPGLRLSSPLPAGWSLTECSRLDLWELGRFYEHHSGGLLLDAFALGGKGAAASALQEVFQQSGFLRKTLCYSLKYQDEQKAVLMADQSDLGLNLAELLNGIKIFVTRPEELAWKDLARAIWQLTPLYSTQKIPIMIYPAEYAKAKHIVCDKTYILWVLSVRYADEFMGYMKKRFRIGYS